MPKVPLIASVVDVEEPHDAEVWVVLGGYYEARW